MNIFRVLHLYFLQLTQTFINDLHPWTTLLGVAAISLCALDVAIRQGKGTCCSYRSYCSVILFYLYVFVSFTWVIFMFTRFYVDKMMSEWHLNLRVVLEFL